MKTRFTVIIPTRERCDTLAWTLKTCVTQEYENLEILVSDNNSADRTKEVVYSFNDPRIKYVNTNRRLSMTDNFEFALSHVTGGFVIIIGDDDGLLPNALLQLDEIITAKRCQALTWRRPDYFWSTFIDPYYANSLSITIDQHETITAENCAKMLQKVASFRMPYTNLPSLYHGCVDYDVIQIIKGQSGKFFHSSIPDAYAAIAITCQLSTYHYSTKAFSIIGLSGHSAGGAYLSSQSNSEADTHNKGALWLSENSIPFHNKLVMFPSLPILTAESFYQVHDHLGCDKLPSIDIKRLITSAVQDKSLLLDPQRYNNLLSVIKQIAVLHRLEKYANRVIKKNRYRSLPTLIRVALSNIFSGKILLRGSLLGINDIYNAAQCYDHIRRLYRPTHIKLIVYLSNYVTKVRLAGNKARSL